MAKIFNWGIIGCGGIADDFCQSFPALDNARLLGFASKSIARSKAMSEKYSAKAYENYEALLADPELDIVYIATSHNFHYENICQVIRAGKHVLCEKPIVINAEQMMSVMTLAREKKVFFMEALWTRFLPAVEQLISVLQEGIIGDLKHLDASFCIDVPFDPEHRLYKPELAGGALLDLGIYPIAFAQMIFESQPSSIESTARLSDTGVDEYSSYLLNYEGGRSARLMSSCAMHAPADARIIGTKGYIDVPDFFHAQSYQVYVGELTQERELPYGKTGKQYEAREVMRCIENGDLESAKHSWQDSRKLLEIMDKMRAQWGLKYPME